MSGVNPKDVPRIEARREKIMALRAGGATWAEIGREIGVTAATARHLHVRAIEVAQERAAGLSMRSRQIIDECGVDVDGLRRRLARGQAEVERILRRRAMCRTRDVVEIVAWLGQGETVG